MELKFILEGLLFSTQKPLSASELRDVLLRAAGQAEDPEPRSFKQVTVEEVGAALARLEREHAEAHRGYQLVCVAGAWQFVSKPECAPWLKALVGERTRPPRLSLAALETLAIIAYRQPLTRAEIEQIRGVSVDGVMQTLMERSLVVAVGRADVIGRPPTYGTTPLFLEYFGLRDLEDLPAADELRSLPVQRPPSLVTAELGLATVPPEQLAREEATGTKLTESAPAASPESQQEPGPGSPSPSTPAPNP